MTDMRATERLLEVQMRELVLGAIPKRFSDEDAFDIADAVVAVFLRAVSDRLAHPSMEHEHLEAPDVQPEAAHGAGAVLSTLRRGTAAVEPEAARGSVQASPEGIGEPRSFTYELPRDLDAYLEFLNPGAA